MPLDDRMISLLTAPEQKFVMRYMDTLNAEESAVEAGFEAKRGKPMLRSRRIREVIVKLQRQSAEAMSLNADWVLQRLYAGVTADLADIFDEHGALKAMDRWPQIWRQGLVAGFESEEIRDPESGAAVGVMRKVKLADRTKLLEMIGKHIKIKAFQENIAIAGVSELAERLNRAAKAIEAEQSMTMIEHRPEDVT
jgi:phage terminase small subunit